MDWYRFLPGYWFQNYPTSLIWDEALNSALDTGEVTELDGYTCRIGGILLWVSNWPHAYGQPYSNRSSAGGFLPTVKTRKRLKDEVTRARIAAAIGEAKKP